MNDFQQKYYEQSNLWNENFSKIAAEQERLKEIINAIPDDVESVLDVGCGNGFFINFLRKTGRYKKLVGLDTSAEALKFVETERVQGVIDSLPFKNNSFDLVTCLEVLEHLPEEDFKKGILELQRVSKKYILITVPNEESLERSLVMCPKCCCWFNPHFHMRSFDKKRMGNLFNNFILTKFKEIGPVLKIYTYPVSLFHLYCSLKKPLPPQSAICPQCGYQIEKQEKDILISRKTFTIRQIIVFPIKTLAKLIWHSAYKKKWLLALYKKNE